VRYIKLNRVRVWLKPQYCPICGSEDIQREVYYDEDWDGSICQVWFKIICCKCGWKGSIRQGDEE